MSERIRPLPELSRLQQELTLGQLAQELNDTEWDTLYPPHSEDSEPFDASGYTGE